MSTIAIPRLSVGQEASGGTFGVLEEVEDFCRQLNLKDCHEVIEPLSDEEVLEDPAYFDLDLLELFDLSKPARPCVGSKRDSSSANLQLDSQGKRRR